MNARITPARLVAAGVVMLLAGIQIGLWLADFFDDGVQSPLSLGIGIAMFVVGLALIALPLLRR